MERVMNLVKIVVGAIVATGIFFAVTYLVLKLILQLLAEGR
jgi:hypothetical protein